MARLSRSIAKMSRIKVKDSVKINRIETKDVGFGDKVHCAFYIPAETMGPNGV